MNLLLKPTYTINELKAHFMSVYPMLKSRFFNHSHSIDEGSMLKDVFNSNTLLGVIGLETETQHHI